jgi:predicted nuclease of restriction endonuclease-like (RecB) superfamily
MTKKPHPVILPGYETLHSGIVELLESARHLAARSVNTLMTATYWEIGRRIVEAEQGGKERAEYGEKLIARLAEDLTARFGRGFGAVNLSQMRRFYQTWPPETIFQTLSEKSETASAEVKTFQTLSEELSAEIVRPLPPEPLDASIRVAFKGAVDFDAVARRFPLPWSAYVRLLSVKDSLARRFYETEALRCGWSVRQLDRQINSQFYQRVALSRNKAAMLKKGEVALPQDTITPEAAIKDPYVLEFLNLKDEYSESDLEEALIHRLEDFLLELGDDFAFIGRQRRLRLGDEWYRVDLLFFHRRLKALVVIDLKIGKFSHADAGQMHLYLNYAREHWTNEGENPPVGLILCAQKDAAVARYALEGLPNKVLAAEYRTTLPDEAQLAEELVKARRLLESRRSLKG